MRQYVQMLAFMYIRNEISEFEKDFWQKLWNVVGMWEDYAEARNGRKRKKRLGRGGCCAVNWPVLLDVNKARPI